MLISHDQLRKFTADICEAAGATEADARQVADHLVEANLKGHDSHGVGMLPAYVRNARLGHLQPRAHARTHSEQGSILVVDGQFGFGQVVGPEAMDAGIAKARETGLAVVALRNAHHLGRIGSHAEHVAQAGLISMHYVNVVGHEPLVSPFGGVETRLGTNPFCCAIPVKDSHPIVLDMATSAIAAGKIRVARNSGKLVPEGCLIDHEGNETRDPAVLSATPKGSQTHFGKHKGFGLAFICEVLAGSLAGGWSAQPGHPREGTIVNHMLSFILDPQQIADADQYQQELRALIDYMHSTPTASGVDSVLIPGEPELQTRAERMAQGIEIDTTSWNQICEAAASLNVSAPG
ncbi:MAG: malate/lactate/ureidoglycolate dehydrogenase [Pseudomonadales bacterium]|nr:malate/lactate/ureidoglycolate dehydrogenase [Pseudomonadales bacterium]